jgi:hypothetical protein
MHEYRIAGCRQQQDKSKLGTFFVFVGVAHQQLMP